MFCIPFKVLTENTLRTQCAFLLGIKAKSQITVYDSQLQGDNCVPLKNKNTLLLTFLTRQVQSVVHCLKLSHVGFSSMKENQAM